MKAFTPLLLSVLPILVSAGAIVDPNHLPHQSESGQSGYNDCGTKDSTSSKCQTAWINSVDDFCLFAPQSPNSVIGDTEQTEVAWCTKSGHGARLIPAGALTGVHWLQTKDYIQITGVGDLTKLNIKKGDSGGELDPHGADGNGNPIGGLVIGSLKGKLVQYAEWHMFVGDDVFSFRACFPGSAAAGWCPHTYDVMGAYWNDPGNYDSGYFDHCQGSDGLIPGVYVSNGHTSTFHQGDKVTPAAHPTTKTYSCTKVASIAGSSYPKARRDIKPDELEPRAAIPTPAPHAAKMH